MKTPFFLLALAPAVLLSSCVVPMDNGAYAGGPSRSPGYRGNVRVTTDHRDHDHDRDGRYDRDGRGDDRRYSSSRRDDDHDHGRGSSSYRGGPPGSGMIGLPPGARRVSHGGSTYYTSGSSWYRASGSGYVRVSRPY